MNVGTLIFGICSCTWCQNQQPVGIKSNSLILLKLPRCGQIFTVLSNGLKVAAYQNLTFSFCAQISSCVAGVLLNDSIDILYKHTFLPLVNEVAGINVFRSMYHSVHGGSGSPLWTETPWIETSWIETPLDRVPKLDRDPLDRGSTGQRPQHCRDPPG